MTRFRRFVLALATTSVLAGSLPSAGFAKQVCYFGECGPVATTPIPAKGPATKVVAEFGNWQVVDLNGQRVVVKQFPDDTAFMVTKMDGKFVVTLFNPEWELTKGQTFPLRANIDGKVFTGTSRALDRNGVLIIVDADFMEALYRGEVATITVVSDEWTLDLSDADRALEMLVV